MSEKTNTKPKMKLWKKLALGAGALVLSIGVYAGSIELWLWRWENPHDPMPVGVASHKDGRVYDEGYQDLAAIFANEMEKSALDLETVSISGAVAIGGTPIWAGTIGLSDVDARTPAKVTHQYRIGSISKSITAVALMRMVDRGLIDLDADISEYLPDYPTYGAPITARQLAGHQAGVRRYATDFTQFPPTDFYSTKHYFDVNEAVIPFRDDALLFTPGQGFSYSTHGYTLLSAVMQAAANKKYLELVDELVFNPAGMTDAAPDDVTTAMPNLVKFYTAEGGLYGAVPKVDLSNKWAGGGFIATPTDLVKLGVALQNGKLMGPVRWTEMVTSQPMFDGSENPQAYAIGWRHHDTINILGEEAPVEVIHHGGVTAGAAAFLLMVPGKDGAPDISIAFASNGRADNTRVELQRLAYRITKVILTAGE